MHPVRCALGRAALAALTAALLALAGASVASAGQFQVLTCNASPAFSSRAFYAFATQGMWTKRACDPHGPGIRGMVTASLLAGPLLPVRSRSVAQITAPAGAQFRAISWSGSAVRSDCRFALQLFAIGPDRTIPIKNVRAGHGCPAPRRSQGAQWGPQPFGIAGTTRIVQRIICVGPGPCSPHHPNYLRTSQLWLTEEDDVPPSVTVSGGSLTQAAWVSGTQSLAYTASDNTGIKAATAVSAGGAALATDTRACDYTVTAPCPNGPGTLAVNTAALPDGTQPVTVRAEDAAGNASVSTPVTAHVDNTAPGRVDVAVAGGADWRRTPSFSAGWTNPAEPDRAPIVAAHYVLCRDNGQDCVTQRVGGTAISQLQLKAPTPGTWKLSVWLEDAAGNVDQRTASAPATVRFDPDPPALAFQPTDPGDPTQVVVQASDAVSGVAGGTIEISRGGSDSWQQLATALDGGRLVARVPDTELPPGDYVARVHATDQAGNEASTDRRSDGGQMVLHLPLRTATTVDAGIVARRSVRARIGRGRARHVVTRWQLVRTAEARESVGQQVTVNGALAAAGAHGLAGTALGVFSDDGRQLGAVTTDASGHFTFAFTATRSETISFAYGGAPTILPSKGDVRVLVPEASTVGVSRRSVLNGQAVAFTGRLRTFPLPPGGKLVELQVRLTGHWQTFRTAHSSPDGSWRIEYRFRRTCGVERFMFRALLRREAGVPYEGGITRMVSVKVRGRPCL